MTAICTALSSGDSVAVVLNSPNVLSAPSTTARKPFSTTSTAHQRRIVAPAATASDENPPAVIRMIGSAKTARASATTVSPSAVRNARSATI